jgi:hypothetical protein
MNKFVTVLFWTLSSISIQANAIMLVDPPMPVEPPIIDPPTPFPLPDEPTRTAINVNIGSIGGDLDNAAIRTVRKVVGHAIATGTVDTFAVTSPKKDRQIPIEGGLSFCVEVGFSASNIDFNLFISELETIQANPGTFYNINEVDSCEIFSDNDIDIEEPPICSTEVKICTDGSEAGHIPNSCKFEPCPEEVQSKKNYWEYWDWNDY